MKRTLLALMTLLSLAAPIFAANDVASAVAGSIKKVDSATKTIVVETDKGVKHTFHYTDEVAVHGSKDVGKTPDEIFRETKVSTTIAVHYTIKRTEETAHEVDVIGDDGLKAIKGTVAGIDRGSKFIVIKTADGSKETFLLTDRAAEDGGKGIAKETVKATTVTVY